MMDGAMPVSADALMRFLCYDTNRRIGEDGRLHAETRRRVAITHYRSQSIFTSSSYITLAHV